MRIEEVMQIEHSDATKGENEDKGGKVVLRFKGEKVRKEREWKCD